MFIASLSYDRKTERGNYSTAETGRKKKDERRNTKEIVFAGHRQFLDGSIDLVADGLFGMTGCPGDLSDAEAFKLMQDIDLLHFFGQRTGEDTDQGFRAFFFERFGGREIAFLVFQLIQAGDEGLSFGEVVEKAASERSEKVGGGRIGCG